MLGILDCLEALDFLDVLETLDVLLKCAHAEHIDFLLGEVTPVAALEVLLGQTSEEDAVELRDLVAKVLEDAAYNAVAAAVDLNAHLLLIGLGSVFDSICMDLAIIELDAFGNLTEVGSCDILVGVDVIDLLLEELRVSELGSQFAIVGEQEYARGVAVETTDGVNALIAGTLDEVHDRLAVLGIVAGGDIILRLVEEHVDLFLDANGLVVELDLVRTLHLRAELGDDYAIDADDASLDKGIGLAARADTGIGEELVQTNGCFGVDVSLGVFDALLEAIFRIGVVAWRALLALSAEGALLTVAAALLSVTATLLETTALTAEAATLLITTFALEALTGLVATFALIAALEILAGLIATFALEALTGLVATFALEALTGLITTFAVEALTRLITAFTIEVLTGLIATFALEALTGLITTGLITMVLLSFLDGIAICVVTRTVGATLAVGTAAVDGALDAGSWSASLSIAAILISVG